MKATAIDHVYLWRDGRRMVRLGTLLGEGASGRVYSLSEMPGHAVKLYHGPEEAARYEAKIDAMLNHVPDLPPTIHDGVDYPQIAWPEAKIYDREGKFIGFQMPEIDFSRSTSLVNLLQKNSRKFEKLSEYYGYRVLVARNLASIFVELHRAGHHMVDMKPANLRFYPEMCWMAVVDADGFSIAGSQGRIAAAQLSDEYIAPESWHRAPSELGIEQDQFALAAIIFQLLNNGVHPFAGTAAPGSKATDLQARILEGTYPYAIQPKAGLNPSTASVHRMFRRNTRELFDAAFLTRNRPSAEIWRDHLDDLIQRLTPCATKPGEHAHFGSGCGFCGHDARVDATRAAPRSVVKPRVPARRSGRGHVATPQGRPRPAPARRGTQRPPVRWGQLMIRSGALVALCSAVVLGSDQIVQRLMSATAVSAAPMEMPASVKGFPQAKTYLPLPADGETRVVLRGGPSNASAALASVGLDDELRGHGVQLGEDGAPWIWATRPSDGMSGFVQPLYLMDRDEIIAALDCPVDKICVDAEVIAGENSLIERYRGALGAVDAMGRRTLQLDQKLWEQQRRSCNATSDPVSCRVRVNSQRLVDLERLGLAALAPASALPIETRDTE